MTGITFTSGPQTPVQLLHRHDEIELGLAEHGSVLAVIGGNKTLIPPARLIVFWATQPHGPVRVDLGACAHSVNIPLPYFLNNADIPADFVRLMLSGAVILARENRNPLLSDLALMKHWVTLLSEDTDLCRRIVLLEITARILRLIAESSTSGTGRETQHVLIDAFCGRKRTHFLRIARLIAERCAEPWSVSTIATEVGLDPSYAMRLFRDIGGVTILECLHQQRVALSQQLLLTTDRKIVDIAFDSGFSSLSSFYESFRRICGQTPTAYRKALLF